MIEVTQNGQGLLPGVPGSFDVASFAIGVAENVTEGVDDEPQRMDVAAASDDVHRLVGQIWSFAKNQLFDAAGPLEGLLPPDLRDALEEARREENTALELYTDGLHRYERDGRKDRDLLNNRWAYISALQAFETRVADIIEHLHQLPPIHESLQRRSRAR
jgi:hypothetical protein